MDYKKSDCFIEQNLELGWNSTNDADIMNEFQNSALKSLYEIHNKNEVKFEGGEILFSCDDVIMNVLAFNKKIVSTFGPHTLIIGRTFEDESTSESLFLKMNLWFHLFKSEELLFEISDQKSIIFHNLTIPVFLSSEVTIELILPENKHLEVYNILKVILNKCNISNLSECDKERGLNFTNSSKIITGAEYISSYLIKGAETTAKLVDTTSSFLVDKINSQSQPKNVNPEFQRAVQTAKIISEKMMDVSEYLGSKIGTAISEVGKQLSSYIKKDGVTILASTYHIQEEEAAQKMQTILNTASVAADGASIVYEGLDRAKNILFQNVSKNTVQIIKSKYGDDVGGVTNDAITTLQNMYGAHNYLKICKPKEFAKIAVKKTGREILKNVK